MAKLSRTIAKRLDRLALRAHAFHRFAHHPLCVPYSGELITLGRRTRVCRGCTLATLGAASGSALAVVVSLPTDAPTAARVGFGLIGLVITIATAGLWSIRTLPAVPARRTRSSKWLTRWTPMLGLSFASVLGLRLGGAASLLAPGVSMLAVTYGLRLYRRRGPNRSRCTTCAEREVAVCSGYLPIVKRERAFARAARRILASSFERA